MTRWLVAPLVAGTLFFGSGWLSALEDTTVESTRLAEASEEAPDTTRAAAQEVNTLPQVAELTTRQAAAFKALADALAISASRVETLTESLDDQEEGLKTLRSSLAGASGTIACIKERLTRLLTVSDRTPTALSSITGSTRELVDAQDKSIRHLKSINRKLTLLGAAATATSVKAPPLPPDAPPPGPGGPPNDVAC